MQVHSPYLAKTRKELEWLVRDQVASLPEFEAKADVDGQAHIVDRNQLTCDFYKNVDAYADALRARELKEEEIHCSLFLHGWRLTALSGIPAPGMRSAFSDWIRSVFREKRLSETIGLERETTDEFNRTYGSANKNNLSTATLLAIKAANIPELKIAGTFVLIGYRYFTEEQRLPDDLLKTMDKFEQAQDRFCQEAEVEHREQTLDFYPAVSAFDLAAKSYDASEGRLRASHLKEGLSNANLAPWAIRPVYAHALRDFLAEPRAIVGISSKMKIQNPFAKSHEPVVVAYTRALELAKVDPERWSGAIFLNAYRTASNGGNRCGDNVSAN